MSRRTKIIIATFFLVLLAIPAVYTVLTWRPENPLRFRIVKDQGLQKPYMPGRGPVQTFVVEVKNASSVPVELFGAFLHQQTSVARSSRDMIGEMYAEPLLLPHLIPSEDYGTGSIPPGGTVYLLANVAQSMDIRLGEVQVSYTWVSRTKGNCVGWSNRIIEHLPSNIQDRTPRIELTKDEATLDVSLLTPSPAHHPTQPSAAQ
jgi:hypothetical protein